VSKNANIEDRYLKRTIRYCRTLKNSTDLSALEELEFVVIILLKHIFYSVRK